MKNDDGTKTYYLVASDISRGIDVLSWTGSPNPKGSPPPSDADVDLRSRHFVGGGSVGFSALFVD